MSNLQFKALRSFYKQVLYNFQGLMFWKGRKRGIIQTRNFNWQDLRLIFLPNKFSETYCYLGAQPTREDNDIFQAMKPLIITMDYVAKPKWCPRWVLRFLWVFGLDKSVVRVRNRTLANWFTYLTKGIYIWDWKTKWEWWDLRISVSAPEFIQNLADNIEAGYADRGMQEDLISQIKKLKPTANPIRGDVSILKKELENLKKSKQ